LLVGDRLLLLHQLLLHELLVLHEQVLLPLLLLQLLLLPVQLLLLLARCASQVGARCCRVFAASTLHNSANAHCRQKKRVGRGLGRFGLLDGAVHVPCVSDPTCALPCCALCGGGSSPRAGVPRRGSPGGNSPFLYHCKYTKNKAIRQSLCSKAKRAWVLDRHC
jgi:hypothetical protein